MNLLEAIDVRRSCRTFFKSNIEQDNIDALVAFIDEYNDASGLDIQFILNDSAPFSGLKSYGILNGVNNYIALVGKDEVIMREKAGYYGERLVLSATQMGLGTCWVSSTYSNKKSKAEVDEGEKLFAVIAIGNGKDSTTVMAKINKLSMQKKKEFDKLFDYSQQPPEWFINGVKSAQKAPSAMNKQPVKFTFSRGDASAYVTDYSSTNAIDLGIAKMHFEVGAGHGKWQFGNYANFERLD